MYADIEEVELGLVVNLKTLRAVLKGLNVGGKRWWIASDPHDAVAEGFVSIGFGDPLCTDRLNVLRFRVPVVGSQMPQAGTDSLVLLFDPSTCTPEEPGYYLDHGRALQDPLEDFLCFYQPIKCALVDRLQSGS